MKIYKVSQNSNDGYGTYDAFRFARADNRPGAERRMVNAAKKYMKIIEECDYFT